MHTPPSAVNNSPLSISALNQQVRARLEESFPLLWVAGEISNLTRAASGHLYFSLKDKDAQVRWSCGAAAHKHSAGNRRMARRSKRGYWSLFMSPAANFN